MVSFSLSLRGKNDSEKWKKNNSKFIYANWFKSKNGEQQPELAKILEKLDLPASVLGVNMTLPYSSSPSATKRIRFDDDTTSVFDQQQSTGKKKWIEYHVITVNQESLHNVSAELYKVVSLLKPTIVHKQSTDGDNNVEVVEDENEGEEDKNEDNK